MWQDSAARLIKKLFVWSGSVKMKSVRPGKRTSGVGVTNVSANGFWLLLDDRELFLSFNRFLGFLEVPIRALLKVEQPQAYHLYWPDLDVDLAVESIEHPERYPLVSRARPSRRPEQTGVGQPRNARRSGATGR